MMEKGSSSALLVVMSVCIALTEREMEVPQKMRNRRNPTTEYVPKGNKTSVSKRPLQCLCLSSANHNSQGMEST